MNALNETPSSERLHIAIFGRRNAGKSSLINAITGQGLAIVSDVPGTTTDPVSKAMELLPLGPVVLTDTAGLDDQGELGALRVKASLRHLERTDLAVLVLESGENPGPCEQDLVDRVKARSIPLVVVVNKVDRQREPGPALAWAQQLSCPVVMASAAKGENVDAVKQALVDAAPRSLAEPTILGDLVNPGDVVVLVVPIDKAAPKGRLILPQVMTIRDALDHDAMAMVVKERELRACLDGLGRPPRLVVTDSQVFKKVAADTPRGVMMTGFSVLMARMRGNLDEFVVGARALETLRKGDRVLISEGCTHHKQADDIGTVQIPRWLRQMVGGDLEFGFSSGFSFSEDFRTYKLIIHCGACTLNRREVLYRQREARAAGIPMTNYGLVLAHVHGILARALEPFPLARALWEQGQAVQQRVRPRLERTVP